MQIEPGEKALISNAKNSLWKRNKKNIVQSYFRYLSIQMEFIYFFSKKTKHKKIGWKHFFIDSVTKIYKKKRLTNQLKFIQLKI